MNKMNKKGFTIVELVIVIAVIAILAGVLIPTFGGIIDSANESAEMQKITAAYKDAYGVALSDGAITDGEVVSSAGYKFTFGKDAASCTVANADAENPVLNTTDYSYEFSAGTWKVESR